MDVQAKKNLHLRFAMEPSHVSQKSQALIHLFLQIR
jgi:hypothetical protein